MHIKLTTNMVIQACGIIATLASAIGTAYGTVSPKVAVVTSGIATVVQALAGYLGHVSNPDGTAVSK